jgi:hypothetical protein
MLPALDGSIGARPLTHHQLSHRPRVSGVALQPGQDLLGPGFLDRRRVQLNDLVAAGAEPGHQRAVVVASRLHPTRTTSAERAASLRAIAEAKTANPGSVSENSNGWTTTSP